ncbi:hypothetical protein K432DRAFT_393479 [Lepidopterella palustris CBS 459.81]|uniref:Uncharacterized protein n=1 Tax=Lepidopterella palustris CBS 459.81 TaxID=1314670 RepID=A0A8E2E9F0_9PEZI|nr:hypothetical protein K432DRAFT_393479 [Lepidopterella palustris CBS 459.81]
MNAESNVVEVGKVAEEVIDSDPISELTMIGKPLERYSIRISWAIKVDECNVHQLKIELADEKVTLPTSRSVFQDEFGSIHNAMKALVRSEEYRGLMEVLMVLMTSVGRMSSFLSIIVDNPTITPIWGDNAVVVSTLRYPVDGSEVYLLDLRTTVTNLRAIPLILLHHFLFI